MDKVDKILTLIEKGYTKAEIDAMIMSPTEPEPEPAAEPEPAPEPEKDPAPVVTADDPVPETMPEKLTTFMEEMRSGMADLKAAVQAHNIQTNEVDTTRPEDLNDFLAAYINPPRVK